MPLTSAVGSRQPSTTGPADQLSAAGNRCSPNSLAARHPSKMRNPGRHRPPSGSRLARALRPSHRGSSVGTARGSGCVGRGATPRRQFSRARRWPAGIQAGDEVAQTTACPSALSDLSAPLAGQSRRTAQRFPGQTHRVPQGGDGPAGRRGRRGCDSNCSGLGCRGRRGCGHRHHALTADSRAATIEREQRETENEPQAS
jgi:hypothetical protein